VLVLYYWSAVLAVTNLTDEFYYESSFARPDAPYFAGTSRPGWPREVFLTLRRAF
jgi:outer membrane receptor protein involved in Fe transport